MNKYFRRAECVLPYTLYDGRLIFTKWPGVRNYVGNCNIQLVKVNRLQQRMQTQEETLFCLFNHERMSVYWSPFNISLIMYEYTTTFRGEKKMRWLCIKSVKKWGGGSSLSDGDKRKCSLLIWILIWLHDDAVKSLAISTIKRNNSLPSFNIYFCRSF